MGGSRPLQAVCKRRPQAAAVGLQRGWEETSVVRSQSPKSSFSGIAAGVTLQATERLDQALGSASFFG